MKTYTKPEITVSVIRNTDSILVVSGGIVTTKFQKDKGYSEVNF